MCMISALHTESTNCKTNLLKTSSILIRRKVHCAQSRKGNRTRTTAQFILCVKFVG